MKKIERQCIGIDCGSKEHVASYAVMQDDRQIVHRSTLAFKNSKAGFEKFNKWVKKQSSSSQELTFVMEATGVYHEELACFLVDKDYKVSIVLPNRARHFLKALQIKTINDKVSAEALATMGLEKKLDLWQKPNALFNNLKQLTRERDQLIHERSQIKCQLHAETSGAWPNQGSILRMKQRIVLINKQKAIIEAEIKKIAGSDPELVRKMKYICSIKGVGLITAVTVVAETNGFALIRNKKQVVSYAGLDVVGHQSGTSIKFKGRISHHGNKHLRKCLHFPALSAIRHSEEPKALFVRLVSKHGIKMKGAVAVQRKILILIYTLWKNETYYDAEYKIKNSKNELGQSRKTALMELA